MRRARRGAGPRLAAVGVVVALCGCARLQSETRVEHGPSLRSFDREGPSSAGGVEARADIHWPALELSFASFDVCRNERVEEYVEERITETSAPSAGPAVGMGVTTTLLGGGLLLAQGLFSSQPNTQLIDQSGRYGASDRQVAAGWSVALLVLGVPALATGLIELSQAGEHTDSRKVEQVVSSLENHCHLKPASGPLAPGEGRPPAPPREVKDGKLALTLESARGFELTGLALAGQDLEVSAETRERVEAYEACAQVLPAPTAEGLGALPLPELLLRLELARQCKKVPGAPVDEATAALEKEIGARREKGEPLATSAGPKFERYEDALEAYKPALHFTPDSKDLAKLEEPELLVGQAAVLQGILAERVEPNIVGVDVGAARVWVYLAGGQQGLHNLAPGSRVEAVTVVMGRQSLGALEAPLLRAVWIRPAM